MLGGVGVLGKVGKEGFAGKMTFQRRERTEWMSGDQCPLWWNQQSETQRECAQGQRGVCGMLGPPGQGKEAKVLSLLLTCSKPSLAAELRPDPGGQQWAQHLQREASAVNTSVAEMGPGRRRLGKAA